MDQEPLRPSRAATGHEQQGVPRFEASRPSASTDPQISRALPRHQPLTPTAPSPSSRTAHDVNTDHDRSPAALSYPRAPRPATKLSGKDKDDIHAAINTAVAQESQAAAEIQSPRQQQPTSASQVHTTAPAIYPTSPMTTMNSSKQGFRMDRGGPIMAAHRTASIDSTVSSISSSTSASLQRANGATAYRVSDSATPQDPASYIAAAGSAEIAVQKLLQEKQQAASHNAQLWRLVEKQRSMILGLNKDLEKALKEKERYRRKLKDQLAQSSSAPALINTSIDNAPDSNEASPAASQPEVPASDLSRDISVNTRKTSDTTDLPLANSGRSDTPQDAARAASTGLPATPQSASSLNTVSQELDRANSALESSAQASANSRLPTAHRTQNTNTPPVSPRLIEVSRQASHGHQNSSSSIQTSPPPSAHSFSSPKQRKAPPAPLKLESARSDPSFVNNIIDASDSEYEEDPESARSEHIDRGRRKTREDDDRERELLVQQEEEQRSRSKKSKKSKSRPSEDIEAPLSAEHTAAAAQAPRTTQESMRQRPIFQAIANPTEIIRGRAKSDATSMLTRHATAPSLMSPGLPMSPRPGDRPPNSPMPRGPNTYTNSIPMSPKAGLPLSPRAPRQPIPLPPQTPLAVSSPHLDRAKVYHQQLQPQPQPVSYIIDRPNTSPDATTDHDRASTPGDLPAYTPGEIYKGLATEQYPDLLLPPNALPSIYVITASSRMMPSRVSYIAPKNADENPVFTMAIHERSDRKQLWRIEKTFAALAQLDQQVKALCKVRDRLPDKQLFAGHAPARIDARRLALNHYFEQMLDSVTNEKAAMIVCKFLSTNAIGGEGSDYLGGNLLGGNLIMNGRSDSPVSRLRPNRAGYLTKRGKNFGGWKARYFVLDGPNLKYFEGPGGAHLGSIKLQNAQIGKQSSNNNSSQDDEENQFRHAFLILEPKKKDSSALVRHVLCAESDEERDAWVDALLQYVDFRDEEDNQPARQAQVLKTEISAPRSPRLQKSMSDLRPTSNTSRVTMQSMASASAQSIHSGQSVSSRPSDEVRTIGYNDTVAGEAPLMYPPGSGTPSPPHDQLTVEQSQGTHPAISGPSNLQVIQNTGDWGMKPPPTPGAKDKKRSMFSGLPFGRGRSSSDLAPGEVKASALPAGSRGVFGVPLAEAVAAVHPDDADTELPAVVYRCIEYLTAKNAISEEGIFRLSGSNTVIKSLKERFNTEGDVNLLAEAPGYDVHAVASLLKLYLRELPASILTRDLHLDFLHCLEVPGDDKVVALNELVRRLPAQNRALLEALSAFMLLIVDNVELNKMNVRNLGVVFSPTLNLPGPLISVFVEEQRRIFGPAIQSIQASNGVHGSEAPFTSTNEMRSPRKQMFSDLPTPAYNQTQFQPIDGPPSDDTGMIPMHPTYAGYQMAPQGEGGFGSLNDALRSPTVYGMTGSGQPTPRDIKAKRRESGMLAINHAMGPQKKASNSRLREAQGTSF